MKTSFHITKMLKAFFCRLAALSVATTFATTTLSASFFTAAAALTAVASVGTTAAEDITVDSTDESYYAVLSSSANKGAGSVYAYTNYKEDGDELDNLVLDIVNFTYDFTVQAGSTDSLYGCAIYNSGNLGAISGTLTASAINYASSGNLTGIHLYGNSSGPTTSVETIDADITLTSDNATIYGINSNAATIGEIAGSITATSTSGNVEGVKLTHSSLELLSADVSVSVGSAASGGSVYGLNIDSTSSVGEISGTIIATSDVKYINAVGIYSDTKEEDGLGTISGTIIAQGSTKDDNQCKATMAVFLASSSTDRSINFSDGASLVAQYSSNGAGTNYAVYVYPNSSLNLDIILTADSPDAQISITGDIYVLASSGSGIVLESGSYSFEQQSTAAGVEFATTFTAASMSIGADATLILDTSASFALTDKTLTLDLTGVTDFSNLDAMLVLNAGNTISDLTDITVLVDDATAVDTSSLSALIDDASSTLSGLNYSLTDGSSTVDISYDDIALDYTAITAGTDWVDGTPYSVLTSDSVTSYSDELNIAIDFSKNVNGESTYLAAAMVVASTVNSVSSSIIVKGVSGSLLSTNEAYGIYIYNGSISSLSSDITVTNDYGIATALRNASSTATAISLDGASLSATGALGSYALYTSTSLDIAIASTSSLSATGDGDNYAIYSSGDLSLSAPSGATLTMTGDVYADSNDISLNSGNYVFTDAATITADELNMSSDAQLTLAAGSTLEVSSINITGLDGETMDISPYLSAELDDRKGVNVYLYEGDATTAYGLSAVMDASTSTSGSSAFITSGLNKTFSTAVDASFDLGSGHNYSLYCAGVLVDSAGATIAGDITVRTYTDEDLDSSANYNIYGIYDNQSSTTIACNISVVNDYGTGYGIYSASNTLLFDGDLSISVDSVKVGSAIYYYNTSTTSPQTMTWNNSSSGTVSISGKISVTANEFVIESGNYVFCDNSASETILYVETSNNTMTINAGASLRLEDTLTVFTYNVNYSIGASNTSPVSLTLNVENWTDEMSPMFSIAENCEVSGLSHINIINLGSEVSDFSAYISDESGALSGMLYYLYTGDLDSGCYAMAGEALTSDQTKDNQLYRISADYQNVESFSTDIIATADFTDASSDTSSRALYITSDQAQNYSMGTLYSDVSMSASNAGASNTAYGVYLYGKVGEIAGDITVTSDGGKTIGLNMSHYDLSGADSVGTLSGNVTASGGATNIAINNDSDSDLSFADGVTITAGAGTSSVGNFYTNSGSYALMSSNDLTLSTQNAGDEVKFVGDIIMSNGTQKATQDLTLASGVYEISNNHDDLGSTIAVSTLSINENAQLVLTEDTQFVGIESSTTLGTVSLVLNAGDSTTALLSITGDCSTVTGLDNGIKLYTTDQITSTSTYIDDENNALSGVSIYLYQTGADDYYGLAKDLTVTSRATVEALYSNTSNDGENYSLTLMGDIIFTDTNQDAAGIYNTGSIGTISSKMYLTGDSSYTADLIYAIYNDGGTINSIQDCTLSADVTGSVYLVGINSAEYSTISSISNVTLNLSSDQSFARGIYLDKSEIGSITNTSITVSSGADAYGFYLYSASIGSISGLTMDISNTSSADNAYGVYVLNASSIASMSDVDIKVDSTKYEAYGVNISSSSIGSISGSITVTADDAAYGIYLRTATAPLNFADTTSISATEAKENYALYSMEDVELTSLTADGNLANADVSLTGDIYVTSGDLSISSGNYEMLTGATITADSMSIVSDASLTLVGDMVLDVDSLTLEIADLSTLGTLLDLKSVTALTTELDTITISLSVDDYDLWDTNYLSTLISDSHGYLTGTNFIITNGDDSTLYGYVDATVSLFSSSALLTITDEEEVKLSDNIEAVIDYDGDNGSTGAGLFNNASSINLITGDITVTTIQSISTESGNTVYGLYNSGYYDNDKGEDYYAYITRIEGDITLDGGDVNATGLHSADLSNVGTIAGSITVTGNLTNYALFLNFDEDIQFDDLATLSASGGTSNYSIGSTNKLAVSTKGAYNEVTLIGDISIASTSTRKDLTFESGYYFLTGNITAADVSIASGVSLSLMDDTTFNVNSLTLNAGSLLTVASGMTVTGLDRINIVVASKDTLDYSAYISDGGTSLDYTAYYFYEEGATDAYGFAQCINATFDYATSNAINWTATSGDLDLTVQSTVVYHHVSGGNNAQNEVATALYNSTGATLDSLKGDWSIAVDAASEELDTDTMNLITNDGTITLISANLTVDHNSSQAFVIYNDNNGAIDSIADSTLEVTNASLSVGIYSSGASIDSISGTSVTVTSTSGDAAGIRNYSSSSMGSISDSSFAITGESAIGIDNANSSSISSLSNVTITATATDGSAYAIDNGNNATMGSISGSFTAVGTTSSYAFRNISSAQTSLSFSGDTTLSATGASEGNNYAIYSSSDLKLVGKNADIALTGDVKSTDALTFTSGSYTWTEQANGVATSITAGDMIISSDARLILCNNTTITLDSLTIDISGATDVNSLKDLLMLTDDTSMTIADKTITVLVDADTYALFAANDGYALELIYDDDLDSAIWGDDGNYKYIVSDGTNTWEVDYDQIAYGFPFIYATEGWAIDEPYATKLDATTYDGTSYDTQLDESISFANQTGDIVYSAAGLYNEASLSALTGSIKLKTDTTKGGSESEYNFAYGVYSVGDIASMEASIELTNFIGNAVGIYNEGKLSMNTSNISAKGSLISCAIWNNSEATLNFAKDITLTASGGSTANYAIYSDSDLTMTSTGTVTMQGDLNAGPNSITLSSGSYGFDNGNATTTITAGSMSISSGASLTLSGDTDFIFSDGTLTLDLTGASSLSDVLLRITDDATITGLDTINVIVSETDFADWDINTSLDFISDASASLVDTTFYIYSADLSGDYLIVDTAFADSNGDVTDSSSSSVVVTPDDDSVSGNDELQNIISTLDFTTSGEAAALSNTGDMTTINSDITADASSAADSGDKGYGVYNTGTIDTIDAAITITGGQNIYAYYTTEADTDLVFTDGASLSATGAAISNYAIYAEGDLTLSTATDSDQVSFTGDVFAAGDLAFDSGSFTIDGDVTAVNVTLSNGSQVTMSGNTSIDSLSLMGENTCANVNNATLNQLTGDANASIQGSIRIVGDASQYASNYAGSYASSTTITVADGAVATLVAGENLALVLEGGSSTNLSANSYGAYQLDSINASKASAPSSSYTLNLAGDITQSIQLSSASDLSNATINFSVSADTMLSGTALVLTSGAAINLNNATLNITMPSGDATLDVSQMQKTGNILMMLSDNGSSSYDNLTINTLGEGWNKYFSNIVIADGILYADLNMTAYSGLVTGKGNDGAGASLLDAALIKINPQLASNKAGHEDLAAVLDSMDAYAEGGDSDSASRLAAAVAGASVTALNSALLSDVERQLNTIRNRTQDQALGKGKAVEGFSAWMQAESGSSRMSNSGSGYHAGHDYTTYGGSIGIDITLTDNTLIGAAFTAMYGDVDNSVAERGRGELDTQYLSFYARHKSGDWNQHFVASVGSADAEMNRTITHAAGSYKTKGSTEGLAAGLAYELSYDLTTNEDKTAVTRPIFMAELVHAKLDGYTETDSDATLNVGAMNNTYATFGLGLEREQFIGASVFNRQASLSAHAMVTADIGHRQVDSDVSLTSNKGTVTTIKGVDPGVIGLELGIGFNLPVNDKGDAVFFNLNYEIRSKLTEGSASLGYRFAF